jgi:hypothetical protein
MIWLVDDHAISSLPGDGQMFLEPASLLLRKSWSLGKYAPGSVVELY